MNNGVRRSEGIWTAAVLLTGVLVPVVVGIWTCSITNLLVVIEEFSVSLWLVVFAALWFRYRTLLRRDDESGL